MCNLETVHDRRNYLINELMTLEIYESNDVDVSELSLTELEQVHIREKCKAAKAYGEGK